MDETLEQLTQEWLGAMNEYNTPATRNSFTHGRLEEARAQMQAAALVVIAENLQKLNLHIDQMTTGPASLNVYATNER